MPITRADLEALDRDDPLRPFRARFHLPPGLIYLDGNSLGALPEATPDRIRQVIEAEWGQDLIAGWTRHGWMDLPARIGDKIATLIGAGPGETMVGDSTSANLFKALGAALKLRPERRVILSERGNFPTDLYIAQGLAALLGQGYELRLVEQGAIVAGIDRHTAVVMLTHVDYRTGRIWDMAQVTRLIHQEGALALWDLSHSTGAVPVDVNAAGADFAVGCGYKFLNGGPGAPGFLFAPRRLHEHLVLPLTGWLGHAAPFAFEPHYRPAAGIQRARVGTPPILSLAALEVGVDLVAEAGVAALRKKSMRQTTMLARLVAQEVARFGFTLASPEEPEMRGSQVSLRHPLAWPVNQALIARGVVGDFRAPDILRLGIAPLYLGFAELWDAVAVLQEIMSDALWDRPEYLEPPKGVT